MREDSSRKRARWTQSSYLITFIQDVNNPRRFKKTTKDLPPKFGPNGHESGPGSPTLSHLILKINGMQNLMCAQRSVTHISQQIMNSIITSVYYIMNKTELLHKYSRNNKINKHKYMAYSTSVTRGSRGSKGLTQV